MPRLQLFELEDQPWFPKVLRRGVTDFLAYVWSLSDDRYVEFVRRLKGAMAAMGETQLLDMASGSAGPVPKLLEMLESQEKYTATALLTDLYPEVSAFEKVKAANPGRVDYVSTPVDATAVPATYKGFRIMCNSFHHLPPEAARKVLADAVAQRRGIAIMELVERRGPAIAMTAAALINVPLTTPFIRPVRMDRLALTYLMPLIPIAAAFDGVVSCLRTYSIEEMRELTQGLSDDYVWDIDRLTNEGNPFGLMMLIGRPANPSQA
ncbi:class I SAM-dependent methyltransferase [Corallococcus sp. ZKHCc1 1396]|uniref:Class I SAM-dependent methyltransferase n=1 Tax=Corallococcus soli TaxID=2710757 RepID=A0ABR9PYI3_9BACT|nr:MULTISPECIES: class I SAM-dependent methyltransferase [Corallococcus]MBE4752990.1 class I SAM-dependent methyltransferase [Corallococcus soli]MCY1037129.1 hypothetical protein [Corallococcus sp. BB11-1]